MSTPRQLSPVEAFEAIQALLKECGPRLNKPNHVRERMVQRNVTDDDILYVLAHGTVSAGEWNDTHQKWRYPVCGHDLDGVPLAIVVVPEPRFCRITVVTVKDST